MLQELSIQEESARLEATRGKILIQTILKQKWSRVWARVSYALKIALNAFSVVRLRREQGVLEARLAETIQPSSRSEQQQQQQPPQQQQPQEYHEGELNLIIPPYPNMPNPYDLGGIELQGVVTSKFF